jgi:hypothetical protein
MSSIVNVSPAGISFICEYAGRAVRCRIEREALAGREGSHPASNSDLRALFEKYQQPICRAVAQKIANNDLELDGTVCIKDIDLKRQR